MIVVGWLSLVALCLTPCAALAWSTLDIRRARRQHEIEHPEAQLARLRAKKQRERDVR